MIDSRILNPRGFISYEMPCGHEQLFTTPLPRDNGHHLYCTRCVKTYHWNATVGFDGECTELELCSIGI